MITKITHVLEEALMKKITRTYLDHLYERFDARFDGQEEFRQAVHAFLESVSPVLDRHPRWRDANLTEALLYPDRFISFKVKWLDDKGTLRINQGYRVQFNSELGPYKGGLRFDPSVTPSVISFLGFEQTFKNALTGLPIGSGKGGADFDPSEASEDEIRRFSEAFISELAHHIGEDRDVPAGDVGVGSREISYFARRYEEIHAASSPGTFTGKPPGRNGLKGREEATGYGLIYFVEEMLRHQETGLEEKRIAVSGAGNVSLHAMQKAKDKGGIIIACSDSSGMITNDEGLDTEAVRKVKEKGGSLKDLADSTKSITHNADSGAIWQVKADIALPCAMENELTGDDAKTLIKNGVSLVAEGANMPCTPDAIGAFMQNDVLFGPGKASNAGGVVASVFEMAQAKEQIPWTFEKTDEHLKQQMAEIYSRCQDAANTYGDGKDLDQGANIAGFLRILEASTDA